MTIGESSQNLHFNIKCITSIPFGGSIVSCQNSPFCHSEAALEAASVSHVWDALFTQPPWIR